LLIIFSPGNVDGLFKEVASSQSDDISAILKKFGCRIFGPPMLKTYIHSTHPVFNPHSRGARMMKMFCALSLVLSLISIPSLSGLTAVGVDAPDWRDRQG
jgi:hypothetical protein